jgi:hypothetical protein
MEVALAGQATFLLPVRPALEQARERALEQKFNVFGTVSKLFVRPKGEEIETSLSEFRYHPFWHTLGHKRFRFERRMQYQVSVAAQVQAVEIAGQAYTPSGGKITIGSETLNLVVPGGAIALTLTKAIADRRKEGSR